MQCQVFQSQQPSLSQVPTTTGIAPLLGAEALRLLDGEILKPLVSSLGSPLNVLFPGRVTENVTPFLETFEHYGIDGRVFFTTKPNRSASIIREIACTPSVGVDVSSEGSLAAALSAGVHPSRIEATGPKDKAYLSLSLLQRIVINIDDLAEIDLICALKGQLGISGKTQILVRLSGFKSPRNTFAVSDGTFGVPTGTIAELWPKLQLFSQEIDLLGFSYHLNTDSTEYRVLALEQTLSILFAAKQKGFTPRVVNIGGGFRIKYAKNPADWENFILKLKGSITGQGKACTWNRSGLGFSTENGRIKGAPRFMDHAEPLPPADQLCALLRQELPSFSSVPAGRLLSESVLELWIEPGRAMLDQAGLTVAEVLHVRKSEQGHPLLVLRMNRSNLNSFELTLLTDPILLSRNQTAVPCEEEYFLTGNLCVANELLTPRLIRFGRQVSPGDLIAFINTAPYIMDFAESPTLHQPVARKIAVWFKEHQSFWALDEEYRPHLKEEV